MGKDKGLSSQTDGAEWLQPPPSVLEIARKLIGAGYESWFVGGAVRDALLGYRNLDWDLATAATPQQVQRLFRRTVPVGIEFGTVGVLDDAGAMHEVTTFRRDVQTDGRHAVVEFGASLDEDLARRDFTINAIAYGPDTRELRDPFHGRADLEQRPRARRGRSRRSACARTGSGRCARFASPRASASRSRRRRGARFSVRRRTSGRLSMERVQQEIEKTMAQVERPGKWPSACGAIAASLAVLRSAARVR